jgi:hypothetical protein
VNTGTALNADGVRIKGSLKLAGGFRAEGEVRLLGGAKDPRKNNFPFWYCYGRAQMV